MNVIVKGVTPVEDVNCAEAGHYLDALCLDIDAGADSPGRTELHAERHFSSYAKGLVSGGAWVYAWLGGSDAQRVKLWDSDGSAELAPWLWHDCLRAVKMFERALNPLEIPRVGFIAGLAGDNDGYPELKLGALGKYNNAVDVYNVKVGSVCNASVIVDTGGLRGGLREVYLAENNKLYYLAEGGRFWREIVKGAVHQCLSFKVAPTVWEVHDLYGEDLSGLEAPFPFHVWGTILPGQGEEGTDLVQKWTGRVQSPWEFFPVISLPDELVG